MRRVPEQWLPGGTPDALIERRVSLGRPVSRVDGVDKVRGAARFAAEIPLQGMVYAALVHSPITRGSIVDIDQTLAETVPGVVLVMTHRNAPAMKTPPLLSVTNSKWAGNSSLSTMQDAEIRWNGQVVAVVLAETQEQADFAASVVKVRYELSEARTGFEDAKVAARTPASVMFDENHLSIGDAESALKSAAYSVDNLYRTPPQNHNAIELHAATVRWEGDRLTVHDATQMINSTGASLAHVFGLKAKHVRVSSPFVGGSFGGKALWDHQILAIAASKVAGRPVRIVLSREGVYRIVGGRAASEQRIALGADAEGRLTALVHTGYSVMPTHSVCPEPYTAGSRHLYDAKTFEVVQQYLDLDVVANTFMRAPGESIGTFALESAIDELAHRIGLDPIELRRKNEPAKNPTSGTPFSQRAITQAYADGARRFGWDERSPTPGARREGEWLTGMGCATGTYPYVRMAGGSVRITLTADGKALVSSASHEMGMGTATVQAQHAADRLGLLLENVRFELGDTTLPKATMAAGSSQTATIAGEIIAASKKMAGEMLGLAGKDTPLAGLKANQVQLVNAGIAKIGEPGRFESYVSILKRAGRSELSVTAAGSQPLELFKYSMQSYSAVFCEVRVSAVTGEVRVSRLLGSFDCGRILNPKTATSQFRGGMIMGIGLALTEETLFDERSGRIMNASLSDYHVPAHLDVPEIDVIWTDIPDPRAPLGARGIGEIGVTGTAAAIANAVFNATGKRVRDLPITPDKLM
jgi:xanthine dehydrogenase YagR molybdenum-binding subunit